MQHTDLPFFVKTTIILTILISIIGVVNESLIAKNNFQSLVDGEIRNIEQSIRTDFSSLSKHLLSLSESPNLLTYISTPTPEAQTTAAEEFLNLARNNPRYDQIRYIDKDGTEKIRLDNEALSPQIAPNNLLQDKSTRYYVTDTLQLNKGEIYIFLHLIWKLTTKLSSFN